MPVEPTLEEVKAEIESALQASVTSSDEASPFANGECYAYERVLRMLEPRPLTPHEVIEDALNSVDAARRPVVRVELVLVGGARISVGPASLSDAVANRLEAEGYGGPAT